MYQNGLRLNKTCVYYFTCRHHGANSSIHALIHLLTNLYPITIQERHDVINRVFTVTTWSNQKPCEHVWVYTPHVFEQERELGGNACIERSGEGRVGRAAVQKGGTPVDQYLDAVATVE